ncbi:hypothetical protein ACH47V_26265 [Micromonospora chersina]|uniref:hypothetical protein n=1 Tax=Micromonospora chersina TaxID=47854 RepID=UPI0033E090DF
MSWAGALDMSALDAAPAHWERVPIWSVVRRLDIKGRPNAQLLSVYRDHGVVPTKSRDDNFNKPSEDLTTYRFVRRGQLVLNKMKTWQGSLAVSEHEGIVSPAYFVCSFQSRVYPRFAHYLLRSHPYVSFYGALSKGIRPNQWDLPFEEFRSLSMLLPPVEEQRRIANFLDAETSRIDNVRSARSRMQELLRLKRERVIEHLIGGQGTSKDFVPLKHLVESVTVGIVITPASWYVESDGVPALRGINVKPGRIDGRELVQISHEGHLVHRKSRLHAGDLVVVRTGQAGAAAVVPPEFDGANCIDLVIVRLGPSLAPRFAEYMLNSSYAKRRVAEFAVGSIQSHFNVAAMKAMPVPRKSLVDQQRIVAEIDRAIEPIERAVGQMEKQDRLLAERRQALITAAVTGQIEVTTARGVNL